MDGYPAIYKLKEIKKCTLLYPNYYNHQFDPRLKIGHKHTTDELLMACEDLSYA